MPKWLAVCIVALKVCGCMILHGGFNWYHNDLPVGPAGTEHTTI